MTGVDEVAPLRAYDEWTAPVKGRGSWERQDLTDVLDPDFAAPRPELGMRDDGAFLLYVSEIHLLFGDSGSAKTWIAGHFQVQEILDGRPVLMIDLETSRRQIIPRALALGASRDQIRELLWYLNPDTPIPTGLARDLGEELVAAGGRLAILDATTELLALHGLNSNAAEDVAQLWTTIARPLATAGVAVIANDHHPKDIKGSPIGSQHKISGVDVAFWAETITPFGHGRTGRTRLRVRKDRDGALAPLEVGQKRDIADITLESFPDGGVTIHLATPTTLSEPKTARDHTLFEAISQYLADYPRSSGRKIETDVTGGVTKIRAALTVLIEEGFVNTRAGEGRHSKAVLHTLTRPYQREEI